MDKRKLMALFEIRVIRSQFASFTLSLKIIRAKQELVHDGKVLLILKWRCTLRFSSIRQILIISDQVMRAFLEKSLGPTICRVRYVELFQCKICLAHTVINLPYHRFARVSLCTGISFICHLIVVCAGLELVSVCSRKADLLVYFITYNHKMFSLMLVGSSAQHKEADFALS